MSTGINRIALALLLLPFPLAAQSPSITATGTASVAATPDQATISVSVTTTASSALDASGQNATQTSNVISALRSVMAGSDVLKTVSYSLNPNYNNAGNLTGYTATNTIQVTTNDLTSIGKLLDTATQAGANRVQSLSFGLKDPQPLRAQALKLAAAQAQTQVAAIAAGLNVKTGAVIAASDSSAVSGTAVSLAPSSSTPIITGTVEVTASVVLKVQILP